jgi:natural product precursor
MKNLNKIKLTKLSSEKMTNRDLEILKGGGGNCTCACRYAGTPGGSSIADNGNANNAGGYDSTGGGTFFP